jgi:hypothetical protein
MALMSIRIVDQALPAHGGTRFFEIHAHDDEQVAGQGVDYRLESGRVFPSRVRVVDGARPDDHQQPVVLPVEDVMDGRAGVKYRRGGRLWHGELVVDLGGREHLQNGFYT